MCLGSAASGPAVRRESGPRDAVLMPEPPDAIRSTAPTSLRCPLGFLPPASFPGWENEGRKANLKVSGSGGAWTQDKLPSFPGPQFTEKVGGGVQVISEDAFLSDSLSICRCLSHILVTWPVSPQPGKS